ncbi:MAG: hypothetical protein JNK48_10405 [Bryobacterales bacterium]|nr:hypothetical protein [Bryobacterales bacterium]
MTRNVVVLAVLAAALQAQPVSYGIKLGAPVNDPTPRLSAFSISSPSRWTGGPFVELHLPRRVSVEFSVLLRASRQNELYSWRLGEAQNAYLASMTDKVKTWDFPLLLKYRFTGGAVRPFVGLGGAWSYRRSQFEASISCLGPQGSCRPAEFPSDLVGGIRKSSLTRFGPAASGGIEIKTKYMTVSPEIRWNRSFSGLGTRNQFSAVVGFTFGR